MISGHDRGVVRVIFFEHFIYSFSHTLTIFSFRYLAKIAPRNRRTSYEISITMLAPNVATFGSKEEAQEEKKPEKAKGLRWEEA